MFHHKTFSDHLNFNTDTTQRRITEILENKPVEQTRYIRDTILAATGFKIFKAGIGNAPYTGAYPEYRSINNFFEGLTPSKIALGLSVPLSTKQIATLMFYAKQLKNVDSENYTNSYQEKIKSAVQNNRLKYLFAKSAIEKLPLSLKDKFEIDLVSSAESMPIQIKNEINLKIQKIKQTVKNTSLSAMGKKLKEKFLTKLPNLKTVFFSKRQMMIIGGIVLAAIPAMIILMPEHFKSLIGKVADIKYLKTTFFHSLGEEAVYRGLIFRVLERTFRNLVQLKEKTSFHLANTLQTTLFAMDHLQLNGQDNFMTYIFTGYTFIFGLLMGHLYKKEEYNLMKPVMAHALILYLLRV